MNKIHFVSTLLFLFPSLTPAVSAPFETNRVLYASSKAVTTHYDDNKALDFTDSTQSEIAAYYGEIGSLKGDDLLHYLYKKITPSEIASLSDYSKDISSIEEKYYLTYTGSSTSKSSVAAWYQITDRNWSISDTVTPETFKFLSASSSGASGVYLYNMYISDASNNDKKKAFSNLINGFRQEDGLTAIDWTNTKRPKNVQVDKEHVWAKNHGFKVTSNGSDTFVAGAPTDLHHLVAADHNTNSAGHNDYFYGEVATHDDSTAVYAYLADGTKEISGYHITTSGKETFEPTDEWKGDIARCLFYMATRYSKKLDKNIQAEPYLYLTDDRTYVDDDAQRDGDSIFHGVQYNLSTLLKWNEEDPVSPYEIHRNNLIYKNVQDNRNPYIDHPEWARRVFDVNWTGDNTTDRSSSAPISSDTSSSTPKTSTDTNKEDNDFFANFSLFGLSKQQSIIALAAIIVVAIMVIVFLIVLISHGSKKQKRAAKKVVKQVSEQVRKSARSSSSSSSKKKKK